MMWLRLPAGLDQLARPVFPGCDLSGDGSPRRHIHRGGAELPTHREKRTRNFPDQIVQDLMSVDFTLR